MRNLKIVFATLGVLVTMVVVGVAGWQFEWWLKEKNVNRQVQITNQNTGVQTAWRDEARNAITDYELVDDNNTAARGALRNKACTLIDRLVPSYLDEDLVRFETKECS